MATKKNDPVKPKKDKWGRPAGDKYYNFNPKTKRYEDPKNVYKYPKSGYGKVDYLRPGIAQQVSDINSARAKDSMQQQNAYYGRPKNAGMKQAQQDANTRSNPNNDPLVLPIKPNEAPKKTYKTGGMVNSNKKVTVSKVAKGRPAKSAEPKSAAKKTTGKVGGISKAPRSAKPKK
jgi:hypothetical protein